MGLPVVFWEFSYIITELLPFYKNLRWLRHLLCYNKASTYHTRIRLDGLEDYKPLKHGTRRGKEVDDDRL